MVSVCSQNMKLVENVKVLADKKGCTPGQLALAWVHAQVLLSSPWDPRSGSPGSCFSILLVQHTLYEHY